MVTNNQTLAIFVLIIPVELKIAEIEMSYKNT